MKLKITEKYKKDLFIALFHTLKNCSDIISIIFKNDHLYIQGMDKSHICLFDVKIVNEWFHSYEICGDKDETICVDATTLHTIISKCHESQSINMYYEGEGNADILHIDLTINDDSLVKGEYNKFFKIPLVDFEHNLMDIPDSEYEAEFSIGSRKMCEITSQMLLFGTDINFKCTQEEIHLITNGVNGEMLAKVPIDDLTEYSIIENDSVDITYSLSYIVKMCLTSKLTEEVQFYISRESPMKIKYDLGNNSSVIFYMAPKIED